MPKNRRQNAKKTTPGIGFSAALVALVIVVFAPARHHEFVTYDDHAFVVDHPIVKQGLTLEGVRWAFVPTNAFSAAGGPVTWLSHMLDVEVFGMSAGPQHIVNVVLHALNSVLLLLVLWMMTGAVGRSACVAMLFAIHPLHVESVAWISERKDVLNTTFWLLATIAYVRYVRRPRLSRYLAVFVLLTLGLLAKPVLATLPLTLLLLDAWPLARAPLSWADRERWWPLVREKIPLLVPAVGVMLLTVAAQREIGAVSSPGALPWSYRFTNAVVAYATYLRKLVWPADLAVFYPYPATVSWWTLSICASVLAALCVFAWRLARTRPYVTVGWFWYLITLIPMIGIVQVGSHSMADRFTYVPLIGIFVAIVWGTAEIVARWTHGLRVATVVAGVAIMAASVVARAQVNTWRTSETLWNHALAVTDGNFRAHAGLAEVAAERGDTGLAIAHYKEALRLAPDSAEWHVNLALLLAERGDISEAADAFRRAIQLRPDDAKSENSLGALLGRQGRVDESIPHYQRALALSPSYALARRNLGLAYASRGDVTAGLKEILEALRLSPNEGQWHYEAAMMLLAANRETEAVAHLKETLRLLPDHQAARAALARIGDGSVFHRDPQAGDRPRH